MSPDIVWHLLNLETVVADIHQRNSRDLSHSSPQVLVVRSHYVTAVLRHPLAYAVISIGASVTAR